MVLHNIIHGKEVGECDQLVFLEEGIMKILFRLIAVNYEARDFGVKRGKRKIFLIWIMTCSLNIGMRGEQAKELCPDFHVFHVQEVNGKADLTR